MTPQIIRRQVVLEELDVARDGRFAIVARRFVDGHDRYASNLWLVPLARGQGRTRALTAGAVHDSRPRISPDGRRVAFRRRRHDGKGAASTLEVLELPGPTARPGEPWTLVAPGHGIGAVAWSPSGERIAYTTATDPPRFLVPEPHRPGR